MSIEQYDYSNITFGIAREFARVENDAFKNDYIICAYVHQSLRFDDESVPALADYEQLKRRVYLFEKTVESTARSKYITVKSDPRQKLFLMKDENNKYIACAHWVLPKYLDLPELSLYQRIRTLLLKAWFYLVDVIVFALVPHSLSWLDIFQEFDWACTHLGGDDTEENLNELRDLKPEQLEASTYPKDYCYYLHVLGVRYIAHGQGYGKYMLEESLKQLGPYRSPPISMISGPAKASLFSAPSARGFYVSIGFNLGSSVDRVLPNGRQITHSSYFKNLHSWN